MSKSRHPNDSTAVPLVWRHGWIAFGSSLVLFCLTAVLIVQRPVFHDEASTWYFAAFGRDILFSKLMGDIHPPVYFVICSGLFQMGGLMLVRFFSALCMALAVGVVLWFVSPYIRCRRDFLICAAVLATSPFLVFCGYFARYYGLVCLEAALLLAVLRGIRHPSGPGRLLGAGAYVGFIVLTNYTAGFLLGGCATILVAGWCLRDRDYRNLLVYLAPLVVIGMGWLPFFLRQFGDGIDERVAFSLFHFIRQVILSGADLVYTLGASDGLPPWSPPGIPVAIFSCVLFSGGFWRLWRKRRERPELLRFVVIATCLFLGCLVIAGLTFAGETFVFLPPRVAWIYFPWIGVALLLPAMADRIPRWVAAGFLLINGTGLLGLLVLQNTTVWAYEVPGERIAAAIEKQVAIHPGLDIRIDGRGYGSIVYAVEREVGGTAVNAFNRDARYVALIGSSRASQWPPSSALGHEETNDPAGSYRLVHEEYFLSEPDAVVSLKERFVGREVMRHKIVLRVFERDEGAK